MIPEQYKQNNSSLWTLSYRLTNGKFYSKDTLNRNKISRENFSDLLWRIELIDGQFHLMKLSINQLNTPSQIAKIFAGNEAFE